MLACNPAHEAAAKPLSKFISVFIAFALCVYLLIPAFAWASEPTDTAPQKTVTLTILAGAQTDYDTGTTTYTTWVNKEYAFTEGDTLETLLNYAVSEGDISGFTADESSFGGKYITSVTSAFGETQKSWNNTGLPASLYWASFFDGQYATGDCALDHVVLEAGKTYQFAWNSYTDATAPVDWNAFYENHPIEAAENPADSAVVLSIVGGMTSDPVTWEPSYRTWVNKSYSLFAVLSEINKKADSPKAIADLTLKDLLTYAVSQGDILGYDAESSAYDDGKYITSLTSKDGVTYTNAMNDPLSLYWSYFCNGHYGSGECGINQVKLVGGTTYQFAWDSFTTAHAPQNQAAWDRYYLDNPSGLATNIPQENTHRPSSQNQATEVDGDKIASLMNNIASSYARINAPWPIVGLSALGKTDSVDKKAFYRKAISEIKNPLETTSIQRNIIALSALGYDATCLDRAGAAFNAIEQMATQVTNTSFLNTRISSLWAYASGKYEVPKNAVLSEKALIESVCREQLSDGGFSFAGGKDDADMTSMAIMALAPYQDKYPEIENAINRALAALKNLQLSDGGFADIQGKANACSTAYAVMALCAVGINPATEWATLGGLTPLSALLNYAAPDLSGFVGAASGKTDGRATEQGFLALVAYVGLLSTHASYNVIEQACKGNVAIPDGTLRPSEKTSGDSHAAPNDTFLAKTSDKTAFYGVVAGCSASVSLAALAILLRKRADKISRIIKTESR